VLIRVRDEVATLVSECSI